MVSKTIYVTSATVSLLGLLAVLATLPGVTITGSSDIACAGTKDEPCYGYFTIQSKNFTVYTKNLEGMQVMLGQNVSKWWVERLGSTGKWTKYNFSKNNTFTKGTTYSFRLGVIKNHPSDKIKWGVLAGNDELDPLFLASAALNGSSTWTSDARARIDVTPHTCFSRDCVFQVNVTGDFPVLNLSVETADGTISPTVKQFIETKSLVINGSKRKNVTTYSKTTDIEPFMQESNGNAVFKLSNGSFELKFKVLNGADNGKFNITISEGNYSLILDPYWNATDTAGIWYLNDSAAPVLDYAGASPGRNTLVVGGSGFTQNTTFTKVGGRVWQGNGAGNLRNSTSTLTGFPSGDANFTCGGWIAMDTPPPISESRKFIEVSNEGSNGSSQNFGFALVNESGTSYKILWEGGGAKVAKSDALPAIEKQTYYMPVVEYSAVTDDVCFWWNNVNRTCTHLASAQSFVFKWVVLFDWMTGDGSGRQVGQMNDWRCFNNYLTPAEIGIWYNGSFGTAQHNLSLNYTQPDSSVPGVTLLAPPNAHVSTQDVQNFVWKSVDVSASTNCTLRINNTETNTSITSLNNTATSANFKFTTYGLRYWNVTCTDINGNLNTSATRSITFYNGTSSPQLTFIDPTPANNSQIFTDSIIVNWSITDDDPLSNISLNASGTLYPFAAYTESAINDTSNAMSATLTNSTHNININKNATIANLTVTFSSVSVGQVDIVLNGFDLGSIATTDTSPKTFLDIEYALKNGTNTIVYSPVIAFTGNMDSSNITYVPRTMIFTQNLTSLPVGQTAYEAVANETDGNRNTTGIQNVNYVTPCPGRITSSYTLTSDITSRNATACIEIGANNLTIECNRFSIYWNSSGSTTAILAERDLHLTNITIQNCNFVHSTSGGVGTASGHAISLKNTTRTTIQNNTILLAGTDGGNDGILTNYSNSLAILNNTITTSGVGGDEAINFLQQTTDVNITDNIISMTSVDNNVGIRTGATSWGNIYRNQITVCGVGSTGEEGIHFITFAGVGETNISYNNIKVCGTGDTQGVFTREALLFRNNITSSASAFALEKGSNTPSISGNLTLNKINGTVGLEVEDGRWNLSYNNFTSDTGVFIRLVSLGDDANITSDNDAVRVGQDIFARTTVAHNLSHISLRNFTIESPNGSINFIQDITVNLSTANMSTDKLNVLSNRAFLNTSGNYSEFNKTANIYLNAFSFTNPIALVDFNDSNLFIDCPMSVCTRQVYSGNTFKFNVSHWTTFSGGEGPKVYWTNNVSFPASPLTYSADTNSYEFNVTWLTGNGTVHNVTFISNLTGVNTSVALNGTGDVFSFRRQSPLPAGGYVWAQNATDDAGQTNQTPTFRYDINKAEGKTNISINGSLTDQTIEVNSNVVIEGFSINQTTALDMFYNGTLIVSITSPAQVSYTAGAPGLYNWTVKMNETQNYTANSSTIFLNVIDNRTPTIQLFRPLSAGLEIDSNISFQFSYSDNFDIIENCTIRLNSTVIYSNISTINGTLTSADYNVSSQGLYYWNVTCFDDAANTGVSETRNFTFTTNFSTVLYLDDVAVDRKYEVQKEVTINVTTNASVLLCLDIGNDINRTCQLAPYQYNYTIDNLSVNKANLTRLNVSLTGKGSFFIDLDNRTDILNGSMNLYGIFGGGAFPTNITLDQDNDGIPEFYFPASIEGNTTVYRNFFYDGTTNRTNITFAAAGSTLFYVNVSMAGIERWNLTNNQSYGNFSINLTGISQNAGQTFTYKNNFSGQENLNLSSTLNATANNAWADLRTQTALDDQFTLTNDAECTSWNEDYGRCAVTSGAYRYTRAATNRTVWDFKDAKNITVAWSADVTVPAGGGDTEFALLFSDGTTEASIYSKTKDTSGSESETVSLIRNGGPDAPVSYDVYRGGVYSSTAGVSSLDNTINWSLVLRAGAFKNAGSGLTEIQAYVDYVNTSSLKLNFNTSANTSNTRLSTGTVTSAPVRETTSNVTSLYFDATDFRRYSNQTLTYYVSCNNGTNWTTATKGINNVCAVQGNLTRWKVDFTNTVITQQNSTPLVHDVTLNILGGLPANISLSVGGGQSAWSMTGVLNGSNVSVIANPAASGFAIYGNNSCKFKSTCLVPIRISSDTGGIVQLDTMNLSVINKPFVLNVTKLQNSPDKKNFTSNHTGGNLTWLDFKLTFWGSQNQTVVAHTSDYTANSSARVIQVRYSKFNCSFPQGVTKWTFFPPSPTYSNLVPFGQNTTRGIYLIGSQAYEDSFNVYLTSNVSLNTCLKVVTSFNNSMLDTHLLNTSTDNETALVILGLNVSQSPYNLFQRINLTACPRVQLVNFSQLLNSQCLECVKKWNQYAPSNNNNCN